MTFEIGRAATVAELIIPQTDWDKVLGPAVKQDLSPTMRELLGFGERASMLLEQFEGF